MPPQRVERAISGDVYADLRGQGEELLTLVRNYATPQQWAAWLRVPLGGAAAQGDIAMVDLLVCAGADAGPGRREDGTTLLHAAAEGGSRRIVQTFIKAGGVSDLDSRETVGGKLSPLHVAAEEGNSRAAGALIEAGAAVNITDGEGRGKTPLHFAALHGHADVVVQLLLHGAEKEAEDDEGYRPLHLAVECGHLKVAKLLLKAGTCPNHEHRHTNRSPLYMAALGGHHEIMRELIESGAEKDACTNRGRGKLGRFTALHAAAEVGQLEAISVLVEAGADIEATSELLSTPLHLASSGGAADAAVALLDAGANLEVRDAAGCTPLHVACKYLRTAVVSVLVGEWGADTGTIDNAGLITSEVVGVRVPDGTNGKEDRVDVILDMLGCNLVPLPGSVIPSPRPVEKTFPRRIASLAGRFSFRRMRRLLSCTSDYSIV